MVTPSTYELKMAMSSSTETATNIETDNYEAVKKAAGPGRRMSDCGHHNIGQYQHPPGHRRRLSVCQIKHNCDTDNTVE